MTAAATRIVDAAVLHLARHGTAATSMQDLADAAEVSKGLLHHHFRDRDTLLARVADRATLVAIGREQELVATLDATAPLDAVWRWLVGEARTGERRLLLELASGAGATLREALLRSASQRRAQAAETVRAVFAALGLVPRVPPAALGGLFTMVVDGFVAAAAAEPAHDRRAAFDALWLAMLELAA